MIDFSIESDWQKIKNEIMQAIPPIPAGAGKYNEWIARIGNFRQAGYQLEEVQVWCGADGDLTEDKFTNAPGSESELEARKILFTIASKNGYVCNTTTTKTVVNWCKNPITDEAKEVAVANAKKLFGMMYEPTEVVYICNGRFSTKLQKIIPDGGSIVGVPASKFTDDILNGFMQFDKGMYIQYNSVNEDKFNEYKKEKPNGSITTDHMTGFKYYYVEADPPAGVEFGEFLKNSVKKLEEIDLPWIAHVFSGNKSIHTIIRVDANDKEEFKARIKKIHTYCKECGYEVDEAVKDISRWGRFPCCKRGEGFQYVMAINDAPSTYGAWEKRHTPTPAGQSTLLDGKGKVKPTALLRYLDGMGFKVYFSSTGEMQIVQVDRQFVKKVTADEVIFAASVKIQAEEPNEDVVDKILSYFRSCGNRFFAMLQKIEITTHTDTRDAVYLYYANGVVKVEANNVTLLPYEAVEGYIWQGQYPTMNREYVPSNNLNGQYSQFVQKITGDKNEGGVSTNIDNMTTANTVIGYLLNRYKDPATAKAVLITDRQADVDGDTSTGGTGKGVFINALEQFRLCGEIDGKDLKNEDRFCFSQYQDGQTIYAIQDIKKHFNFESIYNKITGKFIVEKKCKDKRAVAFGEAPKIVLTSNFIPRNLEQESTKRRLVLLELENYYNSNFTPLDEFGNRFFYDWDEEEWAAFDAYIIRCVQIFLSVGLKQYQSEALMKKKILSSVNQSVKEWLEDIWIPANRGNLNGEAEIKIKGMWGEYEEWARFKKYAAPSRKSFVKHVKTFFGAGIIQLHKRDGDIFVIDNAKSLISGAEPQEEMPF